MTSPMTLPEFHRAFAKIWVKGQGLLADCYAPAEQWQDVRARLDAMLRAHPGFVHAHLDLHMHMKGVGYQLELSPWPFVAVIPTPSHEDPTQTTSNPMPQILLTKPRNPAEHHLVYNLLHANRMACQMSKLTANQWVLPATVAPRDLFDRDVAQGAKRALLSDTEKRCVRVDGADQLLNFLKAPRSFLTA